MNPYRSLRSLIGLALILSACASAISGGSESEQTRVDRDAIISNEWVLDAGSSRETVIEVAGNPAIVLVFEEETFFGAAGCNGYGGFWEIEQSSLDITDLQRDYQGCDGVVRDNENTYLLALGKSDSIELTDGELRLLSDSSELVFIAQDA